MPLTVEVLDANRVARTVATNDAVVAVLERMETLLGGSPESLTESIVTMSGVSDVLVEEDEARTVVMVFNTSETNDPAAVSLTGGTATPDEGVPVPPGGGFKVSGLAAQSAMTQIGTVGQKLTVYTG